MGQMLNFLHYFSEHGLVPRVQQTEVLENLEKNWHQFKYHVIDAPTGVGKSHIALAIASRVKNSYLLTSTKMLQEQYLSESNDLVNIKGKGNYKCGINPMMRADDAPCKIIPSLLRHCIQSGCCPYQVQKQKALASKTMLTNYDYFLYSSHCGPLSDNEKDLRRDVIIADEAHDLEKKLVGFLEAKISPEEIEKEYSIKDIAWRFGKIEKDNIVILESIHEAISQRIDEFSTQMHKIFSANGFSSTDPSSLNRLNPKALDKVTKIGRIIYSLDKVLQPIKIFFESYKKYRWVIHPNLEENTLTVSPLYAYGIFEQYILPLANKFVLMSATIGDINVFCKELAIAKDEINFIQVGTDFPAEQSPVISLSIGRMNYASISTTMPKIVNAVEEIMNQHREDKGIIHSVNYKIAEAISTGLSFNNRKRLVHRAMQSTKFNIKNEELIEIHKKAGPGSVLLSPSLGIGTSLEDEQSRFQIIIKMPFASLGDPRIKMKTDIDGNWYSWMMWKEMLQCSGRSTRSKDDYAVTYCLDESFEYFYKKVEKSLPAWFKERVHL